MHVRTQNALKRPRTIFRPPSLPVSQPSVGSFRSSETPSARGILLLSLFFLASAHLAVKTFFPHPAFWLVGAGAIVAAGTWYLLKYNDVPGFLLTLFVCCHFAFADQQGGLWSYVVCAVPALALFLNFRTRFFRKNSVPNYINFLMIIFVIHQIAGLLFNPYSIISNIQSTVVTISHVFVFYACASIKMSAKQIKRIVSVWFCVVSWIFIIAINQKYHWVITPSPLLPQREWLGVALATTPGGSFGNSELFSEYFCFIFILSFTLLYFNKDTSQLYTKKLFLFLLIIFSTASLLMGGSRSAIILSITSLVIIVLKNTIITNPKKAAKKIFIFFAASILGTTLLFQVGNIFSLNETVEDFLRIDRSRISLQSIVSGEGINRSTTYDLGFHRLKEKQWWLGYGYNLPENNRESMGISHTKIPDYHSLYLQLPIHYGWIGSASFILIIFFTSIRAFFSYQKNNYKNHYIIPIIFGLSLIWAIFLIDQYKISVTRNPSYFLLIWILLGWTHGAVNSLQKH